MTAQPSLFDAPRPRAVIDVSAPILGAARKRGLDTEWAAAVTRLVQRGQARGRVLGVLARAGSHGATDYELGTELGLLRGSACKRRDELVRLGLAESSGERRPTDTGTRAVVWVATELGREINQGGEA